MEVMDKVLIYEEEANRFARFVLEYPNIETGGDLFGYWTHSGSAVVSYVIGPGLASRRTTTSFYQDETYLHRVGTDLYDKHGLQHVGEWHSHHRLGLNEPSAGDQSTVLAGMRRKGWSHFLLLIATIDERGAGIVLANFFRFTSDELRPRPLRIVTLPQGSPFRSSALDRGGEAATVERASWVPGPFTPSPERRPVEEVFGGAWFATPAGKALLRRAAESFDMDRIPFRMVPVEHGSALKLVLPDATLILGAGFPKEAPRWADTQPPTAVPAWSESMEIVDWYRQQRKEGVHGKTDKA